MIYLHFGNHFSLAKLIIRMHGFERAGHRGPDKGCIEMASQVPPEVLHLLNHPDGKFLLVKGKAGTGKTMFCLELIRECGGLYVSTRINAERLYEDTPGLEEAVPPDFIMDAAAEVDENILKDFLKDTPAKDEKKKSVMNDMPLPPLFKRILEKVEVAQIPFVVVIDSWDAIFAFSDVQKSGGVKGWTRDELRTMVINAFRSRAVNLVMVEEGDTDTQMDFLVDGVIEFKREKWNDRIVRTMHLRKMRGTEIWNPEYLYTLHNGRFHYFEPFVPKIPARPKKWKAIPDTEARFSSGSDDLDRLLGGGFKKGSTILLDVGGGVPDAALEQLICQMTANFISQGRALMMVSPGVLDIQAFAQRMHRDLGESEFNGLAKIVEKGGNPIVKDRPYIHSMKFENLRQDFNDWMYIYRAIRQKTGQAILEVIGIDTQEARYGEDVYKEFLSVSSEVTRNEGNLTIRVTRPGMASLTRRCANVSDVYLRMVELNGAVVLYSEKPRSSLYYMDTEASGGNIRITLDPIV